MKSLRKRAITGSLLLAWTLLAVIAYMQISRIDFVHGIVLSGASPFLASLGRIAPGKYLLDLLTALLGAFIFSASCISLGLAVFPSNQHTDANYFAIGATAFLIGEILISVMLLSSIVLYKITPYVGATVIAISLIAGLRRALVYLANRPRGRSAGFNQRVERVVVGLLLAVMLLAVLYSSARLSYDAAVEYFSSAKLMAVTQSAAYTFAEDLFPVSSFHSGVLFAGMIQIFGDQAARLLSWVNGLAILLLGLAIANEVGLTPRARLWFLALMLTTTAFVDLLSDGKVDIISTAPLVAGVYWMVCNRSKLSKPIFALIGLLIGFAMIARPFNIVLAAVFSLIFYALFAIGQLNHRTVNVRQFVLSALWVFPPMIALGAFHLWQNSAWLGSPIAPLIAARQLSPIAPLMVTAGGQSDARLWWQWQFDPKLLYVFRLFYPFTVSFLNSPQSLGNVSPLFVGFLPFLFVRDVRDRMRQRPLLIWLAVAAAITLLLWVVFISAVMEIRYVLFLWLILFIALAQVIEGAIESARAPVRQLLALLVAALLIYVASRELYVGLATYSPIDTSGQAHCYDSELCTFLDPLNQTAKSGERVFVLNAFRYYLRPDLFACSSRAQEYGKLEKLSQEGSPDFWTQLYRDGYAYVTFESNYAIFHTHFGSLPSTQNIPTWLHVTTVSSSTDGLQRVYHLEAVQPPVQVASACKKDAAGFWQVVSRHIGRLRSDSH